MTIPFSVYGHFESGSNRPLTDALQAANGLQSTFRYNLDLELLKDSVRVEGSKVSVRKLERRLEKHEVRGLVVCDQALKRYVTREC